MGWRRHSSILPCFEALARPFEKFKVKWLVSPSLFPDHSLAPVKCVFRACDVTKEEDRAFARGEGTAYANSRKVARHVQSGPELFSRYERTLRTKVVRQANDVGGSVSSNPYTFRLVDRATRLKVKER